jgi:hypothetical protein
MKLLDTKGGNTKLAKTNKGDVYRVAGLSLMPDFKLCPASKAAGCFEGCLKSAGRGRFANVAKARADKAEFWRNDQPGFLDQLRRELAAFVRSCERAGVKPAARLNVLSDIAWERTGIIDEFPGVFFYDYTKRAERLGKTPGNYSLMFSYSGRAQFAGNVAKALETDAPLAVVFRSPEFPRHYLGRPVIDGDISDLDNVKAGRVVIALKAKGPARRDRSGFVVDLDDTASEARALILKGLGQLFAVGA